MTLKFLPRWFQKTPALLLLQVVGGSLRYMLRVDGLVQKMGAIRLTLDGRYFDVSLARSHLLAKLSYVKADVVVMLPSAGVHIHHLVVPFGLDEEELDYQVVRHITDELGLPLTDVYYDWSIATDSVGQGQTILLAVTRQIEVEQYAQLVAETELTMCWVCAEALMWARAYKGRNSSFQYAVCEVEYKGLQLFWFDELGRICVFSKSFDQDQMRQEGFEYMSDSTQNTSLQLPQRFVVNEISNVLKQMGQTSMNALYVTGSGIDWHHMTPKLKSQLGVPVHMARLPEGAGLDSQAMYGGLWQLSEQVIRERR